MWSGDTPEACRIGGPSYACKEKKKSPSNCDMNRHGRAPSLELHPEQHSREAAACRVGRTAPEGISTLSGPV